MGLADWLRMFRSLHARAMKGELQGPQLAEYRAGCDELARALIAAQKLALRPGEAPRQVLRVARALQVDLSTKISSFRGMTCDVSVAGFSVLLGKIPPNEEHTATLRVPGGATPIVAQVRLGEAKQQPGNVRVVFLFQQLPEVERERLETLVIDTALSQLAG
jgi:hypothetical protein